MEILSRSMEDTRKAAEDFIKNLRPLDNFATVVCLHGELGSGKTTFVQEVAKVLGITEMVQSPTFVILKRYKLQVTSYKSLIHVDAYRLKNEDDLRKLGWVEIISDPGNIIFIEWAERVKDIIPKTSINIYFEHISENERKIKTDHARK